MSEIKHVMKLDKAEWWKGSFPMWINAILLSVLGYFMSDAVKANAEFHAQLAVRMRAAEQAIAVATEQNKHLVSGQARIEAELRDLNSLLRKQ